MTRQRLISDARRRARALALQTGRPYQSHLDDVARLAGMPDWREFVADPRPLPEPVSHTPSCTVPHEAAAATEPCDDRDTQTAPIPLTFVTPFWIYLTVTAFATIFWITVPIGSEVTAYMMVAASIVSLCGMLLVGGTTFMTVVIWFLMHVDRKIPLERRRATKFALLGISSFLVPVVGVLNAGDVVTPRLHDLKGYDAAVAERLAATSITLPGYPVSMPVSQLRRSSHGARLRLVIVDGRDVVPGARDMVWKNPTNVDLRNAYVDHPVLRGVATVDCRQGRLRMLSIEAADTYSAKAFYEHRLRKPAIYSLAPRDIASVCRTDTGVA